MFTAKDGNDCRISLDYPKDNVDTSNEKELRSEEINDADTVPKDKDWAWMCCLGCFLQYVMTIGGVIRCFGIFYVAFMEEFNSNAGNAAWIAVLVGMVNCVGGSFANALAVRFGSRVVVMCGGLFLFTGYIASMFATRIEHLFVTYGVLLGIGCSLAWTTSIAHMGQFFKKKRALANGIAFSGAAIGHLILPIVINLLMEQYGLKGTLLVMAALSANVCVAGALLRPGSAYQRKPKTKGYIVYDNKIQKVAIRKENNSEEDVPLPNSKQKADRWNVCKSVYKIYAGLKWSLLKKWSFVLYGISFLLFVTAAPTYFHMTPPNAEQIGHSKSQAAYMVSINGLGQLVGRFGIGFVADHHFVPTYILMAVMALAGAFCSFVTPFITGFIPLCCVGFAFAASIGPVMVLHPVLLAETFGAHRLNSSLGIICLFQAAGFPLSTSIGGILRDATGNWKVSFWYVSATLFMSGIAMLLRPIAMKFDRRSDKRNSDLDSCQE